MEQYCSRKGSDNPRERCFCMIFRSPLFWNPLGEAKQLSLESNFRCQNPVVEKYLSKPELATGL